MRRCSGQPLKMLTDSIKLLPSTPLMLLTPPAKNILEYSWVQMIYKRLLLSMTRKHLQNVPMLWEILQECIVPMLDVGEFICCGHSTRRLKDMCRGKGFRFSLAHKWVRHPGPHVWINSVLCLARNAWFWRFRNWQKLQYNGILTARILCKRDPFLGNFDTDSESNLPKNWSAPPPARHKDSRSILQRTNL